MGRTISQTGLSGRVDGGLTDLRCLREAAKLDGRKTGLSRPMEKGRNEGGEKEREREREREEEETDFSTSLHLPLYKCVARYLRSGNRRRNGKRRSSEEEIVIEKSTTRGKVVLRNLRQKWLYWF